MRKIAIVLGAGLLAACAKKDDTPAVDSTGAMAPAVINLADLAGKWEIEVHPETGDSTLLTYELTATADTTGWSMVLPNRGTIPLRVIAVDGDSVVLDAGPYESALRAGTQVTTHTVLRLSDDRIAGTTVAHYVTSGADSVVNLRQRGRRAQ